ncbi:choice-of-anchor D domain-containing protein, partial [Paucibacter sp. APW11]
AAYRNNGDGNFTAIDAATTCDLPGDFNGDGRSDCLSIAADALPAGNSLSIAQGGGAFEKTANFNLNVTGSELGVASGTVPTSFGALIADFNGDGRSDVLRWAADASSNTLYLSKGDGSFQPSSTFNFTGTTLKDTTDGKADFLVGDFTGHGNVEILRFVLNPYVPSPGGDPCNPNPPVSSSPSATGSEQPLRPVDPCNMQTTRPSASLTGLALVQGSSYNELFVRQDQRPADLLLRVTSPTGLQTRLSYTSVSNPTQGLGADGSLIAFFKPRYTTGRVAGQVNFPKADVAFPMNVVATVEADTGIAGGALRTEYAYKGLRVATNGRGLLGFMQVNQQNPAPDGSQLNVLTDYFQDHPYTGVAAVSRTFKGPLGSTANLLSRSTNGYCEGMANAASVQISSGGVAPTPCASSALVQRPYLAQSLEEGWDVNGEALPVVRKTSTYNGDGDPLTITIQTSGSSAGQSQTFTKQVSNSYETADSSCAADNKSCSWILGRLKRATVSNTVPNLLPSLTASAGSNANATAIAGTLTLPSSATAELTASLAINNIALNTTGTAKATLANNGTAALTVSAINASSVTGAGFSFQSTDCTASLAAKTSCSITVGFTPTVAGSASGKLTVNTALGSRETALSGSSVSASTLSTNVGRVIFADTVVSQTSDSAPLTLTNGATAVTGLAITPPAGFSVINSNCGSSLAASATCSFALRFAPTVVQAYSGNVSISASGGASVTVALNGNGVNASAASLSTSVGRVIFADTVVNQSSDSAALTLTNGATAVTGLSITPPAGFSLINNTCGSSLSASATCSFALRFAPTAVQAYSGNVSISASGGASAIVALNGNGINGTGAVTLDHVSPASSGTVIPAYSTTTLAVYYKNTGTGPVTLNSTSTNAGSVFYNADGSGGTCAPGRSLGAGQKCFLLQGWGGGPSTVNATLTATFGSTVINTPLSAVQKTLDVSASNQGTSTASTLDQVLTIANSTPGAFQFGSPRVRFGAVSGGGSWAIQADACPAVLTPGNSCAITVRYTAGAAGNASVPASVYGQFEWADLLDGNSQRSGLYRGIADVQTLTLSAASLPPPASFSVSPNTLNFADTPTNQTRDSAAFTLSNGAVALSGLTITPPSGFSVISSNCGGSVAASGTCTFALRFAPAAVQTYGGNVAISANGGAATATISVTGKGLGVPKLDAVTASPFSAGTALTPYAASGGHVNFKNNGTANVTISAPPSVTGGGSAYTTAGDNGWCGSGAVIAPGASCGVYVYWSSAPGSYSGVLSVPSNGGTPSVTVAAGYSGALSFSGADFGNVPVNTSADRTITVTNTAAFTARSVNVNALAAPFSVVGNTCGATLGAGASCQVTVRFAPTAASGANVSLRIDGMYNQVYNQNYESAQAGNVMPYTAGLSGNGTPATAPLTVSLSPSSVQRGVQDLKEGTAVVSSNVSGGQAPYSYLWTVQVVQQGSARVISGANASTATLGVRPHYVCDSGIADFLLTVTDAVGVKSSAVLSMQVDSTPFKLQCDNLQPIEPQSPPPAGSGVRSPKAGSAGAGAQS